MGNNRKVVFHRYYFGNGYMANLVYQVEDDRIEFCQSSVFKSWDNGEYHITYDMPVTEDVEDINTRKELLSYVVLRSFLLLSKEVMAIEFVK